MSMDIFNKVLENIDEDYPFSMSPKLILALLVTYWPMYHSQRNSFHLVQKKNFLHYLYNGEST